MKETINNHIIELVNDGKLDISNCKSAFDKLMELYKIKEIPTDTLIDLLEKENYNLTSNDLDIFTNLLSEVMSKEDIDRNINNIKNKWNI